MAASTCSLVDSQGWSWRLQSTTDLVSSDARPLASDRPAQERLADEPSLLTTVAILVEIDRVDTRFSVSVSRSEVWFAKGWVAAKPGVGAERAQALSSCES